jgi:hypothetical protein
MDVICIIGTPRSGTSLTARILNLAGVYLGPESEMRPANKWNPNGFWENRGVAALNRRLLDTLRRDGPAPPRLPEGWGASAALEPEREEARALLAETFGGHDLWGWKEAGTTLVLPFWQHLVPDMRYVICLRNPIDIAASVDDIAHLKRSEILAAWSQMVAVALSYTTGRERILVWYEDYIEARRETIERLRRFIGKESPPGDRETVILESAVDDGLLHHRSTADRVLQDDSLPLDAASAYTILELLRELRSAEPHTRAEIESMLDAFAARSLSEHSLG